MNWYAVIGVVSSFTFLLPVAIIVMLRLYKCSSLTVLMVYYLLECIYNLMVQHIIPSSLAVRHISGILINYMDAPMMLVVLMFFCNNEWKKKFVRVTLVAFLLGETVIAGIMGLTLKSVTLVLGLDITVILIYSFVLFLELVKQSIRRHRKVGRTLMVMAIFFSYGSYGLIYFFYYVQKTNAVNDVFLLFFVSSAVSTILMSFGLFFVSKRLKHLNDLKVTRKELHAFFNS